MVIKKKKGQFFRKNRKGWIKIVEAFISILLISIVLLVVLGKTQIEKVDISSNIADAEVSILRGIQVDNKLRNEILSIPESSLPVEWNGFPEEKVPGNLDCTAKVCKTRGSCVLEEYPDKEIYSESVIITTNLNTPGEFDPRVLKLFCSIK